VKGAHNKGVVNKVIYPEMHVLLGTDASLMQMLNEEHLYGATPLIPTRINLASDS